MQDDVYVELQSLNRHFGFLVQQLRMLKVQFRAVLDIVYHNFDKLYDDVYREIPMALHSGNPHPNSLLENKKKQ